MRTFNDRLKHLIEALNFKASRKFDQEIGVPESQTTYITGPRQTIPRVDYLQKIKARFSNVNIDWLISGDGEMFFAPPKKSMDDLLAELEALKQERDLIKRENEGLKNSVVNLGLYQTAQSANFYLVSMETPVNENVIIFANRRANIAS